MGHIISSNWAFIQAGENQVYIMSALGWCQLTYQKQYQGMKVILTLLLESKAVSNSMQVVILCQLNDQNKNEYFIYFTLIA